MHAHLVTLPTEVTPFDIKIAFLKEYHHGILLWHIERHKLSSNKLVDTNLVIRRIYIN